LDARWNQKKGKPEYMQSLQLDSVSLRCQVEQWPLTEPFSITGHTFETIDVLLVSVEKDGVMGRGEATGVYYKDDRPVSMLPIIEGVRAQIESRVSRISLQKMLPPGGARNALDCALWDLEAKLSDCPAWQLAGLEGQKPLMTTFGCGADSPSRMAAVAAGYKDARAIKIKLTGEPVDIDRIRAVRSARPDVWLAVDANQGFTLSFLERMMPVLVEANVELIEQPLPIGQESLLDGFRSPIPIAADESLQSHEDFPRLAGRFDVVNLKLDKCGGLTEALALARAAHELGMKTMVGNMIGTSLAMAPATLVGQLCSVVDLDGPIFLASDRADPADYANGSITCPPSLWGWPTA